MARAEPMPAKGLDAAVVQLTGRKAASVRTSKCSVGCPKNDCNGCEAGFGSISEYAWELVVNLCVAVDTAEADAMTPPFVKGQHVQYEGKDYVFVRYHKTRSAPRCILSGCDETLSWVSESDIIVKHRTILYYREIAAQYRLLDNGDVRGLLPGGERELLFRAHQHRKWADRASSG